MSRIVFVHAGFPWRIDYPESRPLLLARDLGHDVHTVARPQPGRPDFDGVTMWASPSLRAQLSHVRALRPDLVFVERPGKTMLTALAGRRSWIRGIQWHGRARNDVARGLIIRRVDAVSFTNPYEQGLWPQVKLRQLRDLPYPSDLGFWRESTARSEAFWVDRGLEPPTGPVLVSIANIVRFKQFPQLVEWSAPFLRETPGSRLVLPGYPYDKDEVGRIDKLVVQHGLTGKVDRLGQLEPPEVRQLLAWADVHVVNSFSESQCMAMYEALAVGVPTMLFDNPVLTSAFPTLPVHTDGLSFRANLAGILENAVAARDAIADSAVQQRVEWADIQRHDASFQAGLDDLLA